MWNTQTCYLHLYLAHIEATYMLVTEVHSVWLLSSGKLAVHMWSNKLRQAGPLWLCMTDRATLASFPGCSTSSIWIHLQYANIEGEGLGDQTGDRLMGGWCPRISQPFHVPSVLRAGGQSIRKVASIPFIVHNVRNSLTWNGNYYSWTLTPMVYLTSPHMTRSPRPSPFIFSYCKHWRWESFWNEARVA